MVYPLTFVFLIGTAVSTDSNVRAFQPAACPYQVSFPAPFTPGGPQEGELVQDGVRFSALCIPLADAKPPPGDSAAARLQTMADAIGLQDSVISVLPVPVSGCAQASGRLPGDFFLTARLCTGVGYTFIAEATYAATTDGSAAQAFLASLACRECEKFELNKPKTP